jgi:hypothetical protein
MEYDLSTVVWTAVRSMAISHLTLASTLFSASLEVEVKVP